MLWTATFLVAPFLYKSDRPSMVLFYRRMLGLYSMRRLYTLSLFLMLIAFHFYHLTIFKNHYDVIPSTALCFVLLSHRLCERTFHLLQHRRTLWAGMIVATVCLFVPHFYTLGVTLAAVLVAATFYPTKRARDRMLGHEWWWLDDKGITDLYYQE